MKRFVSIVLCMVILLALGSCDWFKSEDDEDNIVIPTTSKRNVIITKEEVSAQVSQGKVDSTVFGLGANIDEVKKYFFDIVSPWTITVTSRVEKKKGTTKIITETSPYDNTQIVTAVGEKEDMYKYQKGNSLTSIYYNGEQYFFVNGNEQAGVAMIVCNISAYGFEMGNCPSVDVINSLGEPDSKDIPTFNQLFFCLGSPVNPTRLTYNFGDKRLDFIFSDDNLLVVTLTDTKLYNKFSVGAPITDTEETAVSENDSAISSADFTSVQ